MYASWRISWMGRGLLPEDALRGCHWRIISKIVTTYYIHARSKMNLKLNPHVLNYSMKKTQIINHHKRER